MHRHREGGKASRSLLWRCLTLLALALLVAAWVLVWRQRAAHPPAIDAQPWAVQQQQDVQQQEQQEQLQDVHQQEQQQQDEGQQQLPPQEQQQAPDDDTLVPHANLTDLRAAAPSFPPASAWLTSKAARCLQATFAAPGTPPPDSRIYSQWGEDGILEHIFQCIGVSAGTFVEFGTESGKECTTRWLREGHSFTGLLMDGSHENPAINLKKELITAENINQLLHKHKVPFPVVDHMTIDIDYNTWHVAAAVLKGGWRPRSLCIEFNRDFLPHQSFVVPYSPTTAWQDKMGCYFGASALATERLARHYGYRLVAVDQHGVNLFFVHGSALGVLWAPADLHAHTSIALQPLQQLWPKLHGPCQGKDWVQVLHTPRPPSLGQDSASAVLLGSSVTLHHVEREGEGVRLFYVGDPPPADASNTNMSSVGGTEHVVAAPGKDGEAALQEYVTRYRSAPSSQGKAGQHDHEEAWQRHHSLHVEEVVGEFARYIRANPGQQFPWRTVSKAEQLRPLDGASRAAPRIAV